MSLSQPTPGGDGTGPGYTPPAPPATVTVAVAVTSVNIPPPRGTGRDATAGASKSSLASSAVLPNADGGGERNESSCRNGSTTWDVYCDGPLLRAVQSARLFPDSKTFVDMPMKQDPAQVLTAFDTLSPADRQDPEKLSRFVSEYFAEAGSDIVPVTPMDFSPQPSFLERITDERRRDWARSIHKLWALLVRANVPDVALNPQRHSLLHRNHAVVVPGGRFRESYYWDTFWIIRGLLVSGMVDTARGAVLNLLDDVDRFGFVPNGGRLYYTERSQPPLVSDMVCEVYSARPDRAFLARALPSLETEHAFWMDFERGRAVCVPAPTPPLKTFDAMFHGTPPEGAAVLLNRYWGALDPPAPAEADIHAGGKGVGGPLPSRPPRPESYREDSEAAAGKCACGSRSCGEGGGNAARLVAAEGAQATAAAGAASDGAWKRQSIGVRAGPNGACHELAAAAESGWDFSSRWAGLSSRETLDRRASPPLPPMETVAAERSGGVNGAGGWEKVKAPQRDGRAFCLCETATTSVVPVDLNAFLHRTELNIARLHHALADRGGGIAAAAAVAPGAAGPLPVPPPPPPLLSLDEIQRRYLDRRRSRAGSSMGSWSSSRLLEKLTLKADGGDFTAAAAVPVAADAAAAGMASEDDWPPASGVWDFQRPLSRRTMLFLAAARARAKAMEQTMWDGRSGLWRDLLLPTGEQSPSITPACFIPMWAGLPWPVLDTGGGGGDDAGAGVVPAAAPVDGGRRLERCVEALRQSGLVRPGGVRTSLEESGQQWDGRNAWPPLQWMLIKGLRRSADAVTATAEAPPPDAVWSTPAITPTTADRAKATAAAAAARTLASELEEAFLSGALAGWEDTGGMMEKYDADATGKGGGGGEYSLQVGFGWTNGVALDLLAAESPN